MKMKSVKKKNKLAEGGRVGEGKNTYNAYYKGKEIEVAADTSFAAQTKAAEYFKAKKSYEVTVVLAQKDGEDVVHNASEFAEGGKLKKLAQKAEAGIKAGYKKSKEAVEDKIHNEKEKVAIEVLHDTEKEAHGSQLQSIKETIAAVHTKYADGGSISEIEDKWFDVLAGMSKQEKEDKWLQEMNRITKKAASKENIDNFKKKIKYIKDVVLAKNLKKEISLIEKGKSGFKNKFGGHAGDYAHVSAASHLFDVFRQAYNYERSE